MKRFVIILCGLSLFSAAPSEDKLWHLRNLGKAFYENPTTHAEAVAQFKQALALNPGSARERVNYGLALLRAGETAAAVLQLEQAQKQDPAIPHTWFNLGIVAKRAGEYDRGLTQMRGMIARVPADAKAHHNMAALLKLAGLPAEALLEFEAAARLDASLAGPHFQLYNAYRQAGRAADAARELALFQEVKKRQASSPLAEDMEASEYTEIYDPIDAKPPLLTQTKWPDKIVARDILGIAAIGGSAYAWTSAGVLGLPGLEHARDVVSLAAGDDLCVIFKSGAALYRKEMGIYRKLPVTLPAGGYRKAVWIDYDHDYDLDLMLLGDTAVLLRNNGDGTWKEVTEQFPFVKGKALDAVHFALQEQTAARDLIVTYADQDAVLYEDLLNGKFRAVPVPELKAGTASLAAADFNHDATVDILAGSIFLANHHGKLQSATLPDAAHAMASAAMGRWIQASLPTLKAAVANGDGFAGLSQEGALHQFRNDSPAAQQAIKITLRGVKNVKSAVSAMVEVRAGALYQKKIYQDGPLVFALPGYSEADTVRITWPNGLIQNEPRKKSPGSFEIVEAERLSGSCPMIFTWNGSGFEFISDVLGVAPLGASSSDGTYFPVDHDEYVQIPGTALRERNGIYEVRITEELHEVSYLDQIRLVALDHPASTEIYTNDKFKSPPFPDFRLFGVTRRIYSKSKAPHGFKRDFAGMAELHSVSLDFTGAAPDGRGVLILNGWVDWADGSTFLGASQREAGGLVFPYLQMKDTAGHWKTVIEDMGIPSGKPKAIAVDLTGRWLSASREVRIVTNLCVYWDEIFLSESADTPSTHLTAIDAASADLHYRGFSTPVIHPQRKQPERFDYSRMMPLSAWNPTWGMYTRYGDVQELVTQIDDRLLIMGSGDEVTLKYSAANLPTLPRGWQRDFVLLVDGWAKDADANTAYSQTVEPLPFHAMSAYPYRKEEHFPDDASHREYQKKYLTRPALRLIRPLQRMVSE